MKEILNFNADKLFNTDKDDKYVSEYKKVNIINKIKALQSEIQITKDKHWNTSRAFDYCVLYLTNTLNEALGYYMIKCLEEYLKNSRTFPDYVTKLILERDYNE